MMFNNVRFHLLLQYLLIMETVLILFAGGVYALFSRHLNKQVDHNLMTLAEVVTPRFIEVKSENTSVFEEWDETKVINTNIQAVEWFDNEKNLIDRYGDIKVLEKPNLGLLTLNYQKNSSPFPVRTATFSISVNNESSLDGYVRITQSLEGLETSQNELFFMVLITAIVPFILAAIGGWWLTQDKVDPVEQGFNSQQQFTADASHELRGPLTAIKASIDLMRRHPERFEPTPYPGLLARL